MQDPDQSPIIPEAEKGKFLDMEYGVEEIPMEAAIATFKKACNRLLNPAIWEELSGGGLSAAFKLKDEHNKDLQRPLQQGDLVRIDISGPGPASGGGYDWVSVAELQVNQEADADESFAIRLEAAVSPNTDSNDIAHFFGEGSSSVFMITRRASLVTVNYHGRNEVPNTDTELGFDKARNAMVAKAAMMGGSEWQWKALMQGLLKEDGKA